MASVQVAVIPRTLICFMAEIAAEVVETLFSVDSAHTFLAGPIVFEIVDMRKGDTEEKPCEQVSIYVLKHVLTDSNKNRTKTSPANFSLKQPNRYRNFNDCRPRLVDGRKGVFHCTDIRGDERHSIGRGL